MQGYWGFMQLLPIILPPSRIRKCKRSLQVQVLTIHALISRFWFFDWMRVLLPKRSKIVDTYQGREASNEYDWYGMATTAHFEVSKCGMQRVKRAQQVGLHNFIHVFHRNLLHKAAPGYPGIVYKYVDRSPIVGLPDRCRYSFVTSHICCLYHTTAPGDYLHVMVAFKSQNATIYAHNLDRTSLCPDQYTSLELSRQAT